MPEPNGDASDSPPSLTRRLLVWGGSLLGGLAVLVLVAALLLPRLFTSDQLKGYVIPPLEEATGRQVAIDDIGLRVLPAPAIRVSGFRLANREGYGPAPAVQARALNVDVALWPLFVAKIRPTAVALLDPVVRYEVAEGGGTNFDDFGGAADTTEAGGNPLAGIPVSNFRVSGARIHYVDRGSGQTVRLGFDAQLNARPKGAAIASTGTVDLRSVRALLPSVGPDTLLVQNAQATYDVRVVPSGGRVDLRTLRLETAPLTLTASGTLSGLNAKPAVDVTVKTGSTDLSEIAAVVPAASRQLSGLDPQGTLDLEASITGPLSDSLEGTQELSVSASGQLRGGGIDFEGAALLRNVSAELSLSLDSVAVRSIEGTLLEKSLEGRVAVRHLQGTPQVDGHLTGAADLAELSALTGGEETPEASSIRGTANYDVRFAGPADAPAALRPTGEIRLANLHYPTETFRDPIEVPKATMQLTSTGASVDRFRIRSGTQTATLQTTMRNLFPVSEGLAETDPAMTASFTLISDHLDLVELYPEADTSAVSYPRLFAAHLAGARLNGQSPEAAAEELYGGIELLSYAVDGRVEIDTLRNPPQRFDDLTVDVQMDDRRLVLQNLKASTYEGTLTGTLTLDQSGSKPSTLAPDEGSVPVASTHGSRVPSVDDGAGSSSALTYDIQLQGAKAGALLTDWTAVGRIVTGTLNFDVNGDTPLTEGLLPQTATLTALGQSVVADGGLALDFGPTGALVDVVGLPVSSLERFRQFGGPFTVNEGELQLKTWTFANDRLEGTVQGALGLGGSVDLEMKMSLPLSTLQNTKIPSLVGGSNGRLRSLVEKLGGKNVGEETIPVTIHIGGTVDNPTVQVLNRDAIAAALKSLAKEVGLNQLRNLFNPGGGN